MKSNKVINKTKRAALWMMIPVMMTACNSRDRDIKNMGDKIKELDTKIENTYKMRQQATTDSTSRNVMLRVLSQWIAQDAAKIDSLRGRNKALVDSIQSRHVSRLAQQYPLTAFLSKNELEIIRRQLREFHNEWNAEAAQNIIAGRGTLMDLYNVSFDLDYTLFEPSFHIINNEGYLRFNNARLNKICQEFENEKEELINEEILNTMRRHSNQKEYLRNQAQIDEHDRMCNVSDSVYMEIEAHFNKQFAPALDSLVRAKENLTRQRRMLIRERMMEKARK